ncbi:hypothetical protein [Frederiksenia canicola]|uniref:Uncharacterized protein n=1 Tax=Frederiksenia canicola TaxID=123824 RepID=A0ABX9XSP4_9PAST|nr:hypothetical protein [Frederiksenia canicola]RPE93761.1 hypothetical protein EDC49_1274 [Frederiksenia canicola]
MTENKNPITQLKQYKTAKNEPKEPVKTISIHQLKGKVLKIAIRAF